MDSLTVFGLLSAAWLLILAVFTIVLCLRRLANQQRARQDEELFADSKGKWRVASEIDSLERTLVLPDADQTPAATKRFLTLMREWVESDTMGATALALQASQVLDSDLPGGCSAGKLVDVVRRHWDETNGAFRPSLRQPPMMFGGWAARSILIVAAGIHYDDEGAHEKLGAGRAKDLLGGKRKVDAWCDFTRSCRDDSGAFMEMPGEYPVGTVTTDAGVTILDDLEQPVSRTDLKRLAEWEIKNCTSIMRSEGDTFVVARYVPKMDHELDALADGRATRHLISPHLPFFLEADLNGFASTKQGILASFQNVSKNAKQACPAKPGGSAANILDTQAWYDVARMLGALNDMVAESRPPAPLVQFLQEEQDASGGYGFSKGMHPNIYATRAAALLYGFLAARFPSVESELSETRARMLDFIESLKVPGKLSYLGYRHRG
ncbi:MAG: hypothetical protein WEB04_02005 [Dehalococcoidia bacterium]